jgi:hypothetical protein
MTEVSLSIVDEYMTNELFKYNKYVLKKIAKLRSSARERKLAGDFHYRLLYDFSILRDSAVYSKLWIRIDYQAMVSATVMASARRSELARSREREDVEDDLRGLHFSGMLMYAMYSQKKHATQLCIRLTKDVKGKTDNPEDRYIYQKSYVNAF